MVVDDKLDFNDPDDASFLVHEFVHVLQLKDPGSSGFTSCTSVLESERQAYSAQNDYLRQHSRPANQGGSLRFPGAGRSSSFLRVRGTIHSELTQQR